MHCGICGAPKASEFVLFRLQSLGLGMFNLYLPAEISQESSDKRKWAVGREKEEHGGEKERNAQMKENKSNVV